MRDRVPYGTAPAAELPAVLLGAGLEDDEFEAVIGCDSAAGAEGTSLSADFGASLAGDGEPGMVEGASLGCCGSGSGESVPFAGGNEACAEPETLERRDVSFVMSRFLTAGLGGLVLLVKMGWERFPQDSRARSAGYEAIDRW